MTETVVPVWDERQRPTILVEGTNDDDCRLATGSPSDDGDFVGWVNEYRVELQQDLREAHRLTFESHAGLAADLSDINIVMATIANRDPYPLHRYVSVSDIQGSQAYQDAIDDGFFTAEMRVGDQPAAAQAIELMDFVRLSDNYLASHPYPDVVRTLAHETGHALLQRTVRVQIDNREGQDADWYIWAGNIWRRQDQYYGYLLNEAGAHRLAATASRILGLPAIGGPEAPPILEPYRETGGYSFAAYGAVILDTINLVNGHSNELAVYQPLWRMCEADDDSARSELSGMIRRATKGKVRLEELEAVDMFDFDAATNLLERVEQACRVDASYRTARLLRNQRQ